MTSRCLFLPQARTLKDVPRYYLFVLRFLFFSFFFLPFFLLPLYFSFFGSVSPCLAFRTDDVGNAIWLRTDRGRFFFPALYFQTAVTKSFRKTYANVIFYVYFVYFLTLGMRSCVRTQIHPGAMPTVINEALLKFFFLLFLRLCSLAPEPECGGKKKNLMKAFIKQHRGYKTEK